MKKLLISVFAAGLFSLIGHAGEVVSVQEGKASVGVHALTCASLTSIPYQAKSMKKHVVTLLANPLLNQGVSVFAQSVEIKLKHSQFVAEGCKYAALSRIKEASITYYSFAFADLKLTTRTNLENKYFVETMEVTIPDPENSSNTVHFVSEEVGSL